MFEKKLMISGIRRQYRLMEELLHRVETKRLAEIEDFLFYDNRTGEVVRNLKKLRKIQKTYCVELNHPCQAPPASGARTELETSRQRDRCLMQMGVPPQAYLPVHRSGLYTDFS